MTPLRIILRGRQIMTGALRNGNPSKVLEIRRLRTFLHLKRSRGGLIEMTTLQRCLPPSRQCNALKLFRGHSLQNDDPAKGCEMVEIRLYIYVNHTLTPLQNMLRGSQKYTHSSYAEPKMATPQRFLASSKIATPQSFFGVAS